MGLRRFAASDLGSQFGRIDPAAVREFAAGDAAAILAFLVVGEASHHTLGRGPAYFAGVALPFVVGWVVAGPLAGAYAPDVRTSRRSLVASTAVGWVGAAAVAQVLRATPWLPGDAAPTFFLVSVLVTLTLLLAWRLLRDVIRRVAA